MPSNQPSLTSKDKNKRRHDREHRHDGGGSDGGIGSGGGMKDPTAIIEDPLTELLVFLVSIRLSPALLAALHRFVIHLP